MTIRKLEPQYLTCDFDFEMIMAVITPLGYSDLVEIYGHFRSTNDFGGLYWKTADIWSHENDKYMEDHDFTGVILEYDFLLSGHIQSLEAEWGPVLTVTLTDGRVKYVRLWNYVMGRPHQDWEIGGGELWPAGRTPGIETGLSGHIKLDFDNLYAGFYKYEWNEESGWIEYADWDKIDPTKIQELMWGFIPPTYEKGERIPIVESGDTSSKTFRGTFSNWSITNGGDLTGPNPSLAAHNYRLADSYDDSYTVTPARFIDHFWNLGFREIINLYIGASHYFDKKGIYPLAEDPGGYTPYQYVTIPDPVLNCACEAWLTDMLARAHDKGFSQVIASISLEMVCAPHERQEDEDAPDLTLTWVQRTASGVAGTTGWTPTPYLLSICNANVVDYLRAYCLKLADLQNAAGLTPCIQIGEPWWWTQNGAPCFYDEATKLAFRDAWGYFPYEFDSVFVDYTGYEDTIEWMRKKLGAFTLDLRDHVIASYPEAAVTVLLFIPAVKVPDVFGAMMCVANYPIMDWSTPAFPFFQVEDYDWIIENDLEWHNQVYSMVADDLGYALEDTHYLSGFVLRGPGEILWNRINHAARVAMCLGFGHVILWAGPEIRRDNWYPPNLSAANQLLWYRDITTLEETDRYLIDHSPYNNDAGLLGETRFEDLPGRGKVLDLAHEGDYALVMACPNDWDGLPAFTIAAWIYAETAHTGDVLYRADSLRLGIVENGGDAYPYAAFHDGIEWHEVTGDRSINLADWNFIAVAYDGAVLQIYINSLPGNSLAVAAVTQATGAPEIQVGGSTGRQFYGQIGEVLIRKVNSDSAQIKVDLLRWLAREAHNIVELVDLLVEATPFYFSSYHEALEVTVYERDGSTATHLYQPLGFKSGDFSTQLLGNTQTMRFSLGCSAELEELLAGYDIRGAILAFRLTYPDADHTDSDQTAMVFLGAIYSWSLKSGVLTLEIRENTVNYQTNFPSNRYMYFCRHEFKGPWCLYQGTAARCHKTLPYCTTLGNEDHFGGFKTIPHLMRRRVM